MHKLLLRIFFLFLGCCGFCHTQAQDSLKYEAPQMADGMRASGKIYVVVGVLLIILSGIFIYLFRLDRKMTRLEKNSK
jgi:CcmD family protein